jgi:hypothetical protein
VNGPLDIGAYELAGAPSGCDLNNDSVISSLDVEALVSMILAGSGDSTGDFNADGSRDVIDVQRLANVVLGLAPCPI